MIASRFVAAVLLAAGVLLTGCAGRTLPYTPATQPAGARVSAAYQLVADRVRVEIDSDGRRVEEVVVIKPDGGVVRPQGLTTDPAATRGPVDLGVGVGTGGWRGNVGVGTGVSVGIPVGGGHTGVGSTFAYFPVDAVGAEPPWLVRIKLAGIEPVEILVGGAAPAKR